MKRLVIVGAGGHGREALDIVRAINDITPTFEFLGFVDDGVEAGVPAAPHRELVLGGLDELAHLNAAAVVAIGSPSVRRSIVERLGEVDFPTLVHPLASRGSHVTHEPGLIMAAGARVTHGVTLGAHVHLNVDSSVSHDCVVGDFVTITPGARVSGSVTLGDGVWMGINSCAIQGVNVGAGAIVGAGAAVIDDLPAGCTAVGVPAAPLRTSHG